MEPQDQKALEEKRRIEALATMSAYQKVFSSPEGQLVLKDMEMAHHMNTSSFDENTSKMAFKEGERNVVLRIKVIMTRDLKQVSERMSHVQEEPTI